MLEGAQFIGGVFEGYVPFACADLLKEKKSPLVHVVATTAEAERFKDVISFIAPELPVFVFPNWDCLPYDRVSPKREIMAGRLQALQKVLHHQDAPFLLIATASSLTQKVLPRAALENKSLSFSVGESIELETLQTTLEGLGYQRVETVYEPGEYAIRGGIIDIFAAQETYPVRLDLFGDEIDTLKRFDPLSQCSLDKVDSVTLGVSGELTLTPENIKSFKHQYMALFGKKASQDPLFQAISEGRPFPGMEHWLPLFGFELETLFDYLPQETCFTFAPDIKDALQSRLDQIDDYYKTRVDFLKDEENTYRPLDPQTFYLDQSALDQSFQGFEAVCLSPFVQEGAPDLGSRQGVNFAASQKESTEKLYQVLHDEVTKNYQDKKRVLVTVHSFGAAERLLTVLKERDFGKAQIVKDYASFLKLPKATLGVVVLEYERGFTSPNLVLISETDLYGTRLAKPQKRRAQNEDFLLETTALQVGDLLIHIDHGVGRFKALVTVEVGAAPHDCVCLEYANEDKLFVPVESLEVLSRFASSDSAHILDRLGGSAWQARKAKAKKRIKEIAADLIKVAAERHLHQGEVLPLQEGFYNEFCARFPYSETTDQERAIEDVISDLSSGRPMDRLVCGDVGFGKTEVALRAAFVAAQDGKQVAVIAPTTLLCRQHFLNFQKRFQGLNITVKQLSRLVSDREKRKIKEEAKNGDVQILIGTHALLSKTIEFADLGLVIIDEEQRFGVAQKERLKQFRHEVHLLTLTATPIPRTLQMSLNGVKDMSLIATPPVDRLSVHTYVMPYDGVVMREALMREHYRGGQSFYVCPRIKDLSKVYEQLQKLAPELKVVTAHGQMPAQDLEDVMMAFDEGKYDILLATNIIESGIDIPNANTLIVHRSDLFGLAQLYQIRGRVGRGKQRAYAYLTLSPQKVLTKNAQRRLEVMQTLDTLGAGFQLASHDLDIRGAGNILGEEQSGNIKEVGVELYQQLLQEAVEEAQNASEKPIERWVPQLHVGVPVLIPEAYVKDLSVRMQLYRRLSHFEALEELETFAAELIDRFGSLPEEVKNLLDITHLKQLCRQVGVERVDAGPKGAIIQFHNNEFAHPMALVSYIHDAKNQARVRPDQKVSFTRAWKNPSSRLKGLRDILNDLQEMS